LGNGEVADARKQHHPPSERLTAERHPFKKRKIDMSDTLKIELFLPQKSRGDDAAPKKSILENEKGEVSDAHKL
jgi:hypothetical protein